MITSYSYYFTESKITKGFKEYIALFPKEFKDKIYSCPQNPDHHSEGNLNKHLEYMFEYAVERYPDYNRLPDIIACIFLHDAAKPDTATGIGEKLEFPNHDKVSVEKYTSLVQDILGGLPEFKHVNWDYVRLVCLEHLKPIQDVTVTKNINGKDMENKNLVKIQRIFHDVDVNGRSRPK